MLTEDQKWNYIKMCSVKPREARERGKKKKRNSNCNR